MIKIKRKLKSNIVFSKKIAIRFHKTSYYEALQEGIKTLDFKDKEKNRLSTPRQMITDEMIALYRQRGEARANKLALLLKNIYKINYRSILEKKQIKVNDQLHNLVCNPDLLVLAYAAIKANKGALTQAYVLSGARSFRLNPLQRRYITSTYPAPDGMSYDKILATSDLLKKGLYPWGASRRIYIDKPGSTKKRPITIPPFMDRVVQTAIKMVLESVYEPYFEVLNKSFGFRPHKGCHDAIFSLTRPYSHNMCLAIEGDIEGAYNNVDRDRLIEILGIRIKDRKFLNLIRVRLDYQVYDTEKKMYIEEGKGIPQGGIDSPLLWNIYFHEFDVWVNNYVSQYFDGINSNTRTVKWSPEVAKIKNLAVGHKIKEET